MTRYEYIQDRGIEEMAIAMAFLIVRSMSDECESIIKGVETLKPTILEWLKEEIEVRDKE